MSETMISRVEKLEAIALAHRAVLAALMRTVPRIHAKDFWQFANAARAEILTTASTPDGPSGFAAAIPNQKAAAAVDDEFRVLKDLVIDIA